MPICRSIPTFQNLYFIRPQNTSVTFRDCPLNQYRYVRPLILCKFMIILRAGEVNAKRNSVYFMYDTRSGLSFFGQASSSCLRVTRYSIASL